MRYVSPSKRSGRPLTAPDRIRQQILMEEARQRQGERPFDPEAPRTHRAAPHHFSVNSKPLVWVYYDQTPGTGWQDQAGNEYFLARKGRLQRWYDAPTRNWASPEERNLAAAFAYAAAKGWTSQTDRDIARGVTHWEFSSPTSKDHSQQSEQELIAARRCPWDTSDSSRCGAKVVSGHLYCTEHEQDWRDLYPQHAVPMANTRQTPNRGQSHGGHTLEHYKQVLIDAFEDEGLDSRRAHALALEWVYSDLVTANWRDGISPTTTAKEILSNLHSPRKRMSPRQDDFTNNPRRAPADRAAATELVMYIENESDLSPDGPAGQGREIRKTLLKKLKAGTYDFERSVTLFTYLTESGAKRYAKEMAEAKDWSMIFSPATRELAARDLAESFQSAAESGEYAEDLTPNGFRDLFRAKTDPVMTSGQAFVFTAPLDSQWAWEQAPDREWQLAPYEAHGDEKYYGVTLIDYERCNVWLCEDGRFRAKMVPR